MQLKYFVSKDGQSVGPWTIDEIVQKMGQFEVMPTDFVYDEKTAAWLPILECAAVMGSLRAKRPSAPPPSLSVVQNNSSPGVEVVQVPTNVNNVLSELSSANEDKIEQPVSLEENATPFAVWFVQKASHRFGPLTYLGVIRALQEKSVFEFDYIWREGMEDWVRVAEHPEFTPEKILTAMQDNTQAREVFMQRQHPRFDFKSDIIAHNERDAWTGESYQASEGGSGVIIRNAMLQPGQIIRVHFAPQDGVPAFNATCEVVSKKYMPQVKGKTSPIPYGVKFLEIDENVRIAVRRYYSSRREAA